MKISELQPKQGDVEIEAQVTEIGEVREFSKFGKQGRVATAKIRDDTGEIALSLWNEQLDTVAKGDTIRITGGYVKEWQGELQLTAGMRGTLEVIKKAEQQTESQESAETESVEEEKIEE